MSILCSLLGHKITRLQGVHNVPLMTIDNEESGVEIRIDYCSRCRTIHARHLPKIRNYVIKETVEVLSAKVMDAVAAPDTKEGGDER